MILMSKKLRSKMGDKGEYIKTVWGMGYKFEVGEWKKTKAKKSKKIHSLRHQITAYFIGLLIFIHSDYYRDQRSLS